MKIWETDTFWSRVDKKLDKKGMDLQSLAFACGLNANTLYNQRSLGRIPKAKGTVLKMAQNLGTSPEYLMSGQNDQEGLTPDEERLLLLFSQLSEEKKKAVLNLIASMF